MRCFIFILIIVLACLTRFLWLDKFPLGFTPDEATFGYDAYNLLKTGRDEWGTAFWKLPVTGLKSYGDYKLPLYSFLTVPAIRFFGLNEFSTRLPNSILSFLAILVIYLLTVKILGHTTGLLAALLLTVSPWYISLSRGAFEANLAVIFVLLGMALCFYKRPYLGALILALGMYSYHSARLLTPLILLGLSVIYIPKMKIFLTWVIFLILSGGAFYSLIFLNPRSYDISIFNPPDKWQSMSLYHRVAVQSGWPGPLAQLLYNKLTFALPVFIKNYLTYFSPDFLFFSGPGEATYGMLPGLGVIYLIEFPLLMIFLVKFIQKPGKIYFFILLLLFISPVPAALTKGPGFAANRSAVMIIPLVLLSAVGGGIYLDSLAGRKGLMTGLFLIALLVSFGAFTVTYTQKLPLVSAKAMGYGWLQALPRILKAAPDYPEIRFSRSLSEPQIYLAFYTRTDPRFFQASTPDWSDFENQGYKFLDQYDGYKLSNFRFGNLFYPDPVYVPTLYVGRPEDFPASITYFVAARYPDDTPAIVLAEKSP